MINPAQVTDRFPGAAALEKLTAANARLSQKLQVMNTLFEISNELALTWDETAALTLVADAISGQLMVDSCAVYLVDDGEFRLTHQRGFQAGDLAESLRIDGETATGLAGPGGVGTVAGRLRESLRRSLGGRDRIGLVAPIVRREKLVGLFVLGHRPSQKEYVRDDNEFLAILGGMTAVSLENILYFQQSIEQERVNKDLAVARTIQESLLPPGRLKTDWFELTADCAPTFQVGGDFFDHQQIPGKGVALAIGDVSGKGVSASILMSYLLAGLRSLMRTGIGPAKALETVNQILLGSTDEDQFSTLFFGLLESDTRSFRYINAGHPPPILRRADGAVKLLTEGGLLIGAFAGSKYSTTRILLNPGDLLVFYTDGVLDAQNVRGESFSFYRLLNAVHRFHRLDAEGVCRKTLSVIRKFQASEPQFDDLTMMAVKVLPG